MDYPKKIMSKKELLELGESEAFLTWVCTRRNQRAAWKKNPNKQTSAWQFDTAELEKMRAKACRLSF